MLTPGIRLADHTSLKIGGPADYFIVARDLETLINSYKFALKEKMPVFVLGSGTNILVSDDGIRGLVIKNMCTGITYGRKLNGKFIDQPNTANTERHQETHWKKGMITFSDLDYTAMADEAVEVDVLAGTQFSSVLNQTIDKGLTGLQWFARIPGTMGGAVWNNIHGANRLISNFLQEVRIIDENGNDRIMTSDELRLDYNKTNFQTSNDLIVSARLRLLVGDKNKARKTADEWIKRKSIQPWNSAGCTFSNLTEKERDKAGLENLAAAYVIDKVLGMKGYKIGKVQIYQGHANFLVTEPGAKAADALEIIHLVQKRAKEKIGIELKPEIKIVMS